MRSMLRTACACLLAGLGATAPLHAQNQPTPHPILFVTVAPLANDFGTIAGVFGTHPGNAASAGRGGDLWIRYTDGALRNITREAGLGLASVSQSGPDAIAVRDVSVHWNATRAVFSLVKGSPAYWQMYEVAGPGLLSPTGALTVTKVPNQPLDYNNIEPTYASDGTLIFVSDSPRNGARHLYPQQDEYESSPIVTGLWRLDPQSGALALMNHSPSGVFNPMVDSFGRVVFTRWDHLERDQQEGPDTFNWLDESNSDDTGPSDGTDVFPEHKFDPLPNQNDHSFNFFFPWQINQDGTEEEVLNHLGRQELARNFLSRLTDDPRIVDFANDDPERLDDDGGLLHITENPRAPGCFVGTDAPEFGRFASDRLLRWCGTPSTNAEDVEFQVLTANGTGSYRDALILDTPDTQMIAAHSTAMNVISNRNNEPNPSYRFRLKRLVPAGNGRFRADATPLTDTATMQRDVSFGSFAFDAGDDRTFWELSPVEVRVRTAPPASHFELEAPELAAFQQTGVDPEEFRAYLAQRNLGLVVMRDITSRDDADRQQPYNLSVPGGRETLELNDMGQVVGGKVYPLGFMQFFQADQIRGYYNPSRGRRPIAQHLHDPPAMAANPHAVAIPKASMPVALDGSVVAAVPSRRALSWQSLSPAQTPVVLERYWITLQPGEIRACDGCHGVNRLNQANQPASTQTAQALVDYLQRWRIDNPSDLFFRNGFEN